MCVCAFVCVCMCLSAFVFVCCYECGVWVCSLFLCVRVCARTCSCDFVNVRAYIRASMLAFACVLAISAT